MIIRLSCENSAVFFMSKRLIYDKIRQNKEINDNLQQPTTNNGFCQKITSYIRNRKVNCSKFFFILLLSSA